MCLIICMIVCTTCILSVCFWFFGPIKMMYLSSVLFPLDSNLYHEVIIHHSFTILHLSSQNSLQHSLKKKKKKKNQSTKLLWLSPSKGGSLLIRERDSTADGLQKSFSLKMQNSVLPYITTGIFIFILAMLYGMWDLCSPIRDWTCVPCIGSTES